MNTAYLNAWMVLISEWMTGCWLNEYCLSVCMNGADLWLNGWLLAEWILPICMHEWRWSLNEGLAVYCRMNTAYLYAWMVLISEWRTGCLLKNEYCLSVCMNGANLWMNGWLLAGWILPICMHEWHWSLTEWLAAGWMNGTHVAGRWMALSAWDLHPLLMCMVKVPGTTHVRRGLGLNLARIGPGGRPKFSQNRPRGQA